MKFVLFSDIDGTLIKEGSISPENLEAIKRFRAEGHLFMFCTGRIPYEVHILLDAYPCLECDGGVLSGGGGIYQRIPNSSTLSPL
ncbi:MAG: HAD family hydrolase, partial [Brevinema sp.]